MGLKRQARRQKVHRPGKKKLRGSDGGERLVKHVRAAEQRDARRQRRLASLTEKTDRQAAARTPHNVAVLGASEEDESADELPHTEPGLTDVYQELVGMLVGDNDHEGDILAAEVGPVAGADGDLVEEDLEFGDTELPPALGSIRQGLRETAREAASYQFSLARLDQLPERGNMLWDGSSRQRRYWSRAAAIWFDWMPERIKHPLSMVLNPAELPFKIGMTDRMASKWEDLVGDAEHFGGPRRRKVIEGHLTDALSDFLDVQVSFTMSPADTRHVVRIALGHILTQLTRCRKKVLRNNAKLKEASSKAVADQVALEESCRDQGFVRPRVLILAPMRNDMFDIVSDLIALAVPPGVEEANDGARAGNPKPPVINLAQFTAQYGPPDESDEEDAVRDRKPADFKHTFRDNTDDDFRFGIALGKRSVKLLSEFYSSDIIAASPLGLRRLFESDEKGEGSGVGDFLSSIEIVLVVGCDTMQMQNWDHLVKVLGACDQMPGKMREGVDIRRVRELDLDGKLKLARQSIFVSQYSSPELAGLVRSCENRAGLFRMDMETLDDRTQSVLTAAGGQKFIGVGCELSTASDCRLEAFKSLVVPELRRGKEQTIVFVPTYMDYVRVRNYFVKLRNEEDGFKFASICEYSKAGDVTRSRGRFFNKRVQFLVVTERFHFYFRYALRGGTHVAFYGLPEHAHFYSEICNSFLRERASEGHACGVTSLYDRFDGMKLGRVVGSGRQQSLVQRPETRRGG